MTEWLRHKFTGEEYQHNQGVKWGLCPMCGEVGYLPHEPPECIMHLRCLIESTRKLVLELKEKVEEKPKEEREG